MVSRRLRHTCYEVQEMVHCGPEASMTYRAAISEVTYFQMLEYLQKEFDRDAK